MSTKTNTETYDCSVYTGTAIPGKNSGFTQLTRSSNSISGSVVNQRITNPDSVKDFRIRIARGESATTSLQGSKTTVRRGFGGYFSYEVFTRSSGQRVEGALLVGSLSHPSSLSFPTVPNMTQTDNRALTKFMKQAVSAQRSLQGLVCLGELGETLRMIASPAKALRKGISEWLVAAEKSATRAARVTRAGRRLNASERNRAIGKALAGGYLEWTFGVKPLVSDIDSAAKAAARIVAYRPPRTEVRGGANTEGWGPRLIHQPAFGQVQVRVTFESKYEYNCKFYGQVINRSGWDGTVRDLGLGFQDFIPTIWELIPYSFVVDYFTNIGEILEAACFNRADFAWVNRSTRQVRILNANSVEPVYNPLSTNPLYRASVSFTPGSLFSSTRQDVTRAAYVGSLIPSLEFTIPGLGTQWINIGALIGQAKATSRRIGRL